MTFGYQIHVEISIRGTTKRKIQTEYQVTFGTLLGMNTNKKSVCQFTVLM